MSSPFPSIQRVRMLATQVGADGHGNRSFFTRSMIGLGALAGLVGVGYYYYVHSKDSNSSRNSHASSSSTPALDPNEFRPLVLDSIKAINHNTSIFRFALKDRNQTLEFPTASFVLTRFIDSSNNPVIRPYTPVSQEDEKGYLDLLVKKYPGGAMSSHIHNLKPGDSLDMKGHILKYKLEPNQHRHIAMIAGGTGITPMLQIIHKLVKSSEDRTQLKLIFGNVSEQDILLKEELDKVAKSYPDRFKVYYIIDKPMTKDWKGATGYMNKDYLQKILPSAQEENIKVFVCGPPPMVKSICGPKAPDYSQGELSGYLKDLGYTSEQVFKL